MAVDPDRVKSLFLAASGFPDSQQQDEYLDRECQGDLELRNCIERLLQVFQQVPSVPEAGATLPVGESDDPQLAVDYSDPTARVGSVLAGRYTLVEEIGAGGMGTVFMAQQTEPVRRRVAVKVIKAGMDSRAVLSRFEAERQALAMMDHPNIAKVLDAGATVAGRPFFVMELVKGVPITQFCDEQRLTTRQRLELFVPVCHAIQHAHQKGIIHRDIKPSNVLVTIYDDRAVPKVIDFGVAKASGANVADETLMTRLGMVVGTPEYMSPEQAQLNNLDIDSRSDIYSLGVLLYELLTGTTPVDQKSLDRAAVGEILRIVREVDAPPPSAKLSSLETLPSVAANRGIEPARLPKLLKGELDWVVLKALEKDRSRRYETANGLARDIQRYLSDEAVEACPPSTIYRLRKFARKHRAALTTAAALSMLLIGGTVVSAWQARIAAKERDAAVLARQAEAEARGKADTLARAEADARALAESNAARSEAVNGFLIDMLGAANIRELGRSATIAQALDAAAARVGSGTEDRSDVAADLERVLARSYLSIGELDKGERHVAAALELDERVHGKDSKEYVNSLGHRAFLEYLRGDADKAVETYESAEEISRRVHGPSSKETLTKRADKAVALLRAFRNEEAAEILRETLAGSRTLLGDEHADVLRQINSLAVALHGMKQYEEAEALYREAYETGLRLRGGEDPDTLVAQANLGMILQSRRKFAEAEELLRNARARIEKVFGEDHPKTGESMKSLGTLFRDQGRFKEAVPELERAIEILSSQQGDRTHTVLLAKATLADCLYRLGELERSIAIQRELIDLNAAQSGPESRDSLDARLSLATTLATTDYGTSEAEKIYEDSIEVATRVLGPDDPYVGRALIGLAVMRMTAGRFADAEAPVRRGIEISVLKEGKDSINTLINEYNLSVILREIGKLEEAETLGDSIVERARQVFGPKHANLAVFLVGHAETLRALGRGEDAARDAEEARQIAVAAFGERHPRTATYALELARDWLEVGKFELAEPLAAFAVEVIEAQRGATDRRTAAARAELARCRLLQERFEEAESLLLPSHEQLVAARPAGHAEIQRVERYLIELYTKWAAREPQAGHGQKAAKWQETLEASQGASKNSGDQSGQKTSP